MIKSSDDLGVVLKNAAIRHGVECRFDTHFEAQNWELSWWDGKLWNRLDFQPCGIHGVTVTHYRDTYSFLPKFWRWAHRHIPYVPYMAKIDFDGLGHIAMPAEEYKVLEVVDATITKRNALNVGIEKSSTSELD